MNKNFKITFFIAFFFLSFSFNGVSRELLSDLDFTEGEWVLVGVSLHNYKILPIQEEIGTFTIRNVDVLRKMQKNWDKEEVYEDFCDYHYALKFYQDGELRKTLRANLLCNYISHEGLSYRFTDEDLLRFRSDMKKTKWSRIRFSDLESLQKSLTIMREMPKIYWYGNVKQYDFGGRFILALDNLPWNADRDSIIQVQEDILRKKTGMDNFFVDTYCWYLSEDFEKMSLRLNVYCDEDFYKKGDFGRIIAGWRSHLHSRNFLQIIVIGMNKKDYFKKVKSKL